MKFILSLMKTLVIIIKGDANNIEAKTIRFSQRRKNFEHSYFKYIFIVHIILLNTTATMLEF